MPIYEYVCQDCGHEVEYLQKISDDPIKRCPACNSLTLEKKISAAAFRLKGSGWYETDFKGDKDKKRNLAKSAETKPEAKTDKKDEKAVKKTAQKAETKSNSGEA